MASDEENIPKLWNPDAAANWSLLFSPLFGAVINYLNWKELNRPDKANASLGWALVTGGLVILMVLDPTRFPPIVMFLLLIVWYFLSSKEQSRYVKEKLDNNYEKKEWILPLIAGFTPLVVLFMLAGGMENINRDYSSNAYAPTEDVDESKNTPSVSCSDKAVLDKVLELYKRPLSGDPLYSEIEKFEFAKIRRIRDIPDGVKCNAKIRWTLTEALGNAVGGDSHMDEVTYEVEAIPDTGEFYVEVYDDYFGDHQ